MDYELIKLGLIVLNMLCSGAMYIYMRADREQRATVKSIEDLKESVSRRFDDKCQRINRVEADLKAMPTRAQVDRERELWNKELVRLHERIDGLNQTIHQSQLLLHDVYMQTKQFNNNKG